MPTLISAEQFHVSAATVETPGNPSIDLGVFSRCTGGDTTADVSLIYLGNMQPAVPLGGRRSVTDVTCERQFQFGDAGIIHNLRDRVGRVDVSVTKQPKDADKQPYGVGETFTGKLTSVTSPEHDASSVDPTTWSITIQPGTTVGLVNNH